jgi:quercetin dioxygenase-like cupin family protein
MESLPPAGTRIRNAFNGETFIFTHVDEGANEFQCDVFIEVGGMKTGTGRQHLHPDADEEFIVKQGKLKLMVDGEWRVLAPGERLLVQRGVPHLFRNGHEGETLFTTRFAPAQQFLRFFLNMSLNTANHPEWYDERGEPPLVLRALALHAFAGHGYGAGIPIWFQKVLFAALTPIAVLQGYRLAVSPMKLDGPMDSVGANRMSQTCQQRRAADSDRVSLEPGHETIPPPDEAIFIATRRHPETNAEYKRRAQVTLEFLSKSNGHGRIK